MIDKRLSAYDLGALGITIQQVCDAHPVLERVNSTEPSGKRAGFTPIELLVIVGERHQCALPPLGGLPQYCDECHEYVVKTFVEH